MRLHHRTGPLLAAATVLVLTACGSHGPTHGSTLASPGVPTLGAGFYDRSSPPPPEGTVTPTSQSFAGVHPPAGYRVVLLRAGSDAQTRVLASAVRSWADQEHVRLTTVTSRSGSELIPSITKAIDLAPQLIISVGDDLVDPLATVTASSLHQQFLVVGAELAEPTGNVTAADWKGASFRGEGLGSASTFDAASFTPARAMRAVRAGVAAVLNDLTGIVVWIG